MKSRKQVAAMKEKAKSKPKSSAVAMPRSENESVRIEKISNGYLAHHSRDTAKGYEHITTFHPQKPQLLTSPAVPRKKEK